MVIPTALPLLRTAAVGLAAVFLVLPGRANPETRPPTAPAWPQLPDSDGAALLPAQEWPLRPGPRSVRVLVHYPSGTRASVNKRTGLLVSLHNWGGEDCVGSADPRVLAREFNTIAVCVNYLQSGRQEGVLAAEPYDFGWLQALDALRTIAWLRSELARQGLPHAAGRLFATGGSGGGQVALMAAKLAPRSFAGVVDLCGMKQLSDDIAFGLPGGSELNARWNPHPAHPHHLSPDAQELRDLGHPVHLGVMARMGCATRFVTVHGVHDTVCPFADAVRMARHMTVAGLDVRPFWISEELLDGGVFTSSGHALGDRTAIVLHLAGAWLREGQPESLELRSPSDFDRRETMRYPTRHGTYVIDYTSGIPEGRFERDP